MTKVRMNRRGSVGGTLVALVVGLTVLAGCSGGGGEEAGFVPVAGSDSAYCKAYRAWKMHELDVGEGYDQPNPAALGQYWNEYLIAEETMLREAPPEIREEVAVKVSFIRTLLTPLMEKYDFDVERLNREGTVAERALLQAPPPEVLKAQAAQYAYEDRACGTAPAPPAADVVFEAAGSVEPFCSASSAFSGEFEKVASSRFDPDVLRAFVAGDRFAEALDTLADTAPAEIAADVQADTEWFRTRWNDVIVEFEYDIRGVYLDGTPEELAVFNRSHPDVVEHASRITAYEEQVCEG